jgi:hypothetical protein
MTMFFWNAEAGGLFYAIFTRESKQTKAEETKEMRRSDTVAMDA